ncbi:MAG: SPASM domain-containing protein [Candidatus Omnitrophica bacterium]|nr:SPASM domain-containing protein [Candidatus Omnitrophota bacterium]
MSRMSFYPNEILFSPTSACNLSCGHCDVKRMPGAISADDAVRFMLECKKLGVKRIGFTGGEPFLRLEFLCEVSRRAVAAGFLFDRIMTNAVWWSDENKLKVALIKLYNSGYDGSICVSVDAFHKQSIKKVARFITLAARIWERPDIISIAYTAGAKDIQTRAKIRAVESLVKRSDRGIFLKKFAIELSPVGRARGLKDPWDGRWFSEDYCKGPGNVFFVMSNGSVRPCCGYANENKKLAIGNIKKDRAGKILASARRNAFVRTIFGKGLSHIRRRLESLGVRFPGRTGNHCFFCSYVMTKVPRRILARALQLALLIFMAAAAFVSAEEISPAKDLRHIPANIVRKIPIPKSYHEGIFFDGSSLWLVNGDNGPIWTIDPGAGNVISSIQPVSDFAEALVRADDGALYTTEWSDKKIYRVRMEGSKLISEKEASFAPGHPAGLISANGRIFVVIWTRGAGTRYYLVEMDRDLNEIGRMEIKGIHEPDQLAWDGTDLWISSWYSNRIYKINTSKWELAGSFRSPVDKTTGIAWDGEYMWVTGTHGDLYCMELGG